VSKATQLTTQLNSTSSGVETRVELSCVAINEGLSASVTFFTWSVTRIVLFLQGVSIACYAEPCISNDRVVRPSVRLSSCSSVTRLHWVKTTQARITKSSPTDSQRTLVFWIKNHPGIREGVKWEWGRKNSQFSANKSPYLRNVARWDWS